MVEFSLPKNSKIREGKTWPAAAGAKRPKAFRVYRWNGDDGETPQVDTYTVDLDDCGPMVLDAIIKIKNEIDPTVTFRRSCREGVCGSCAMMVNGKPRWTCRTLVETVVGPSATLTLAPLRNLPVIKDLVADMNVYFEKWGQAKGSFDDGGRPETDLVPVDPATDARRETDETIDCINCGVC